MIEIGVVTRAHGLAGQVRVKLFTEDPDVLATLRDVVLRRPEGGESPHRLLSAQAGAKGLWVVRLSGCDDRDAAESLQGALLCASRDALAPLAPDEFYLADTVGCPVQTVGGELLGTVESIGDNGAQSLLLIRSGDRLHNVPAVTPFIADFDGQRLVLDLPDGLWDAVAHPEAP